MPSVRCCAERAFYPKARFELESPGIKRFGSRIAELEEEEFGIKNIDSVVKSSRAKLKNLRAIELKVIFHMSSIDRYLDSLKSMTYLFDKDIGPGIADSLKNFESIKRDIRKQALNLYEDIELIGEKK